MRRMTYKEKEILLEELLEEAKKRGFLEGDTIKDGVSEKYYDKNHRPITTYKCAKSGKDCTFYFFPSEIHMVSKSLGGGVSLTDGKGGYIYYGGKWAENTTKSWLREQSIEKILK
jgi:hypothetical protein